MKIYKGKSNANNIVIYLNFPTCTHCNLKQVESAVIPKKLIIQICEKFWLESVLTLCIKIHADWPNHAF